MSIQNRFREENERARRHEEKMMQMQMQMQMIQMMNGQNTSIAASSPLYQRQNNNPRREYQQSWGMGGPNLHPQAQTFVQSLDAPLEENCFLDLS